MSHFISKVKCQCLQEQVKYAEGMTNLELGKIHILKCHMQPLNCLLSCKT